MYVNSFRALGPCRILEFLNKLQNLANSYSATVILIGIFIVSTTSSFKKWIFLPKFVIYCA